MSRRTKEQILEDLRKSEEIKQMPKKMIIEKLQTLSAIVTITKPRDGVTFGDNQNYEIIWDEIDLNIIKSKILKLIKEL